MLPVLVVEETDVYNPMFELQRNVLSIVPGYCWHPIVNSHNCAPRHNPNWFSPIVLFCQQRKEEQEARMKQEEKIERIK